MNLTPWRRNREDLASGPGTVLADFRREIDRLFDRFWSDPWMLGTREASGSELEWGPTVNVSESDEAVTVEAELPGLSAEDIDIRADQGMLRISGEKTQTDEEKKRDYHRIERHFGHFQRAVELPSSADPSKVDATFKDGVLEVTIPKDPSARPKRIDVKIG
jgi:HSP20 family protein